MEPTTFIPYTRNVKLTVFSPGGAVVVIFVSAPPPQSHKCVLLIVSSLGCLTFTVQNDVCAEFVKAASHLHHSSAEGGTFLCVHIKSEFKMCTNDRDLVWKPIVVQYAIYTSVMYKLEVSIAH